MKKLKLLYILLFVLVCLPHTVCAENYDVYVTKKESNVYKVDNDDVIILTRFCYVNAYSGKGLLKSTGYSGEIVFTDSQEKCFVKGVYGRSNSFHGNYEVQINRETDDWYAIVGKDNYIKTSKCLKMIPNQLSTITLNADGWGNLIFGDGKGCIVEGIYTQLLL